MAIFCHLYAGVTHVSLVNSESNNQGKINGILILKVS